MAFYHVGGCSCPIGCCDCGDNSPQKTEEQLLKDKVSDLFSEIERYKKRRDEYRDEKQGITSAIIDEAYERACKMEDEFVARARKEADEIIRQAKEKASRIVKVSAVKKALNKSSHRGKDRLILYRYWAEMEDAEFVKFMTTEIELDDTWY